MACPHGRRLVSELGIRLSPLFKVGQQCGNEVFLASSGTGRGEGLGWDQECGEMGPPLAIVSQ